MRSYLPFLTRLWANWLTILGTVLTTMSGLAIVMVLFMELGASKENVYSASFLLIALPMLFAAGLLLIPFGLYIDRRRQRAAPTTQPPDPIRAAFLLAVQDRSARRRILFFGGVSLCNLALFSYAGHKTITYMDSAKFCGTTCHTVMRPEWEAYNRSPHSRVACVQCHIGPGASWGAKAKINGLHQVYGVLTHSYHTPVPTPVEQLRPSRDTCEQCHWPQKFTGGRLKLFPHYSADEKNSPKFNALLVHIGGENPRTKKYEGVHWHVSADNEVRYEYLDRERNRIGKVTVLEKGNVVAEYLPPGKQEKALGVRVMDCVDCHNRPTHITDITPRDAVDRALYSGALDPKVPFMAKVSIDLLARPDVPREQAEDYFRAALASEYGKSYPAVHLDGAGLDKAARTLGEIFQHNVYPEMKVGWNTYRSNLGHHENQQSPGCYRCHDKEHEAKLADGKTKVIGQDCESCHDRLAFEEDPAKLDDTLQAMLPKGE